MPDLWPESFDVLQVKAPVTILKEQAAALGRKTKGLVDAKVVAVEPKLVTNYRYNAEFAHQFVLVAPALNYQFLLLSVTHNIEMYPVRIHPDGDIAKDLQANATTSYIQADTESDFLLALEQVFASSKTRRVVEGILTQVIGSTRSIR